MADAIRVLVVDDHAVVREGLRTFLDLQDGIEVVGEAGDGEAALVAAERLRPDVVLMDLVMPRLDGVARCASCAGGCRDPRDRAHQLRATTTGCCPPSARGAAGYLLKDVAPAELVRAVRAAHGGRGAARPGRGGAGWSRRSRTAASRRPSG